MCETIGKTAEKAAHKARSTRKKVTQHSLPLRFSLTPSRQKKTHPDLQRESKLRKTCLFIMQKSGKDVSPEATLRRARSGCIIVYLFIYRYIYVVKAWAACRSARRARPYSNCRRSWRIAGGMGGGKLANAREMV